MSDAGQLPADGPADAPAGRRGQLRLVRRASWNLIDQVLSAVTNMALTVLVVHAAGKRAFDAFAIAFLLFSTMIGIQRALVGQPLGIRHSSDVGAERRHTISRAMGLVVTITIPAALAMLAAGLGLGGRIGTTLVATSVVLPFLILQDACRYAFFAAGESKRAAFNDALWAVIQFSAMALIIADGRATASSLVLAWGGAAAVCVVVALIQLRAVPNPLAAASWLREHRDLVWYFFGEYMLTTGAFNGGYLTVGAMIGDSAVGSIRAAQTLLGPLQIVAGAGMSFGLPELSRRAGRMTNRARRRIAFATTAAMVVLSLLYTGVLHVVPDSWVELLFKDKWAEAQPVLLPLALAMVLSTASLGPAMIVYALGLARRSFRIIVMEAPMVFTLMIAGTVIGGVVGAAWGQFTDQAIVLVLWYATMLSAVRHAPEPTDEDAAEPDVTDTAPPADGTATEHRETGHPETGHRGPRGARDLPFADPTGGSTDPRGLDLAGLTPPHGGPPAR